MGVEGVWRPPHEKKCRKKKPKYLLRRCVCGRQSSYCRHSPRAWGKRTALPLDKKYGGSAKIKSTFRHGIKKGRKIWRYHFFIVHLSLKIVNISDILPMNVNVIDNIRQYFSTQPVRKAWLFGSFSRGEETAQSDVDILVEFDRSGKPVTLLTYARMWRELEERLGRNVDLVEDGTLKSYAVESANHDKRLIYERKD